MHGVPYSTQAAPSDTTPSCGARAPTTVTYGWLMTMMPRTSKGRVTPGKAVVTAAPRSSDRAMVRLAVSTPCLSNTKSALMPVLDCGPTVTWYRPVAVSKGGEAGGRGVKRWTCVFGVRSVNRHKERWELDTPAWRPGVPMHQYGMRPATACA